MGKQALWQRGGPRGLLRDEHRGSGPRPFRHQGRVLPREPDAWRSEVASRWCRCRHRWSFAPGGGDP